MTRIVDWGVGKKPRYKHFMKLTVIDEEMICFIAQQMVQKYGLMQAAVALLHAANLRQRKIGEILNIDHSTVSRRLKDFLGVYRRFLAGSGASDVKEK